jgi:thiol-disulfide isomerase/thioredoxin
VSATKVETSHGVDPEEYELDPATGLPFPVQARSHEVNLYLADISLLTSIGFSDWLALEARLPLRLVKTTATFRDEAGNEIDFDSIHHRDETLFGPGDLELWNRFRIISGSPILDLRLGASLPTGGIEDNPYQLGREGKDHQHVFFGSGTLDPIAGVDATFRLGEFMLATTATVRAALYENPRGYRAGMRVSGGAFLARQLGSSGIQIFAGPSVQYEGAPKWDGKIDGEGEGSEEGRTDIIANAGVMWMTSESFSLRASVQKPFTVGNAGEYLEIPLVVSLGADYSFDAFAPPDDHHHGDGHDGDGHDHGDEHDHDHGDEHGHDDGWLQKLPPPGPGADVKDAATDGDSFPLASAIAPGKVTVVDFWAEWCEPCHDIDKALRSLAGQNPDLAVRRVEIIDFDSPAAKEHLRGIKELPVVWIYDKNGKRVDTLVATDAHQVYDRVKERLERK